jgi:hypothetical protein
LENTRKVFECSTVLKEYGELGLFAVHKIVHNEEYATRILPYSPTTPRDIKLILSGEFATKTKNILDHRSSTLMGVN